MSELPKGWAWTELGATLLDLRNGIATKPDQTTGLPILRISAVRPRHLDLSDVRFLPENAPGLSVYDLRDDDLLFTRYNGNRELVGACARVRGIARRVVYPDKLIRGRVDGRVVDAAFVEYAVNFGESRSYIESKGKTAAGQIGISGGDLRLTPVPVAPLTEQKRIVAKLDDVLGRSRRAREELAAIPALLERYRQSVLAAAFRGDLTADWRTGRSLSFDWIDSRLDAVASGFSYGSAAKSSSKGDIPVLRMGNIQHGRLDWQNLAFTSDPLEIAKYLLRPGELLFNRTNSPELVGKTAVYRGDRAAIYAGYLIRVQCGNRLVPDFFCYHINSTIGREWCRQVKSDGVSQSNINATKLAAYVFSLPTIDEQHEIVRRIDAAFARIDVVRAHVDAELARLDSLDRSILTRAFRGELVPQDPNDEPASVLLERIRIERSQMPAKGTRRPRVRAPQQSARAERA